MENVHLLRMPLAQSAIYYSRGMVNVPETWQDHVFSHNAVQNFLKATSLCASFQWGFKLPWPADSYSLISCLVDKYKLSHISGLRHSNK